MAAEAAALLDALMGQDRNAPVPGASGLPSTASPNPNDIAARNNTSKKRSCYDPDICPLYCAWSLSSTPTWYETMALSNDTSGGIDIYDLFTNTKSDLGPNPFRVDEHARVEYASLPDHEKRRLGYEEMLCRKLFDLVRQCDRSVSRNKEKLRQEVARAMKARHEGKGRGNREDLIVTINEGMLDACANSVAETILMEEEMANLVVKLETLETEEKELVKSIREEGVNTKGKKRKKKKKLEEEPVIDTEQNEVDPRILRHQKKKLDALLALQSLSLRLPPLRDTTDNLLRQLQYLRSDTATDKVVCEVSGNFMSSRDADERIAAHYAGKQYVGWKLVRDKLKELQKRGFGRGGPIPPPMMMPSENHRGGGGYDRHPGGYGGGGGGGYNRRGEPPRNDRYDAGYNNRDRGNRGGGGYDNRRGYDDRRGGGGYDRGGRRY